MTITPAILEPTYEHVTHKLFLLEGVTEWVQIDLCDGIAGLEKTWLPYKEKHLPDGFSYEFDLMAKDWRKYVPRVIALGAKRIVVHVDSFSYDDISELIAMVAPHFIFLGLCGSNEGELKAFAEKVHHAEQLYHKLFIQVMGIAKVGTQSQPFDERVLKRISYLRDHCRNIDIQVDGSMNPETIFVVKEHGVRCVIVGSYITRHGNNHKEIKKTLETLRAHYG